MTPLSKNIYSFRLKTLILLLIAVPFVISSVRNYFVPLRLLKSANLELRKQLVGEQLQHPLNHIKAAIKAKNFSEASNLINREIVTLIMLPQPKLKKQINYQIIQELQILANLPLLEKQKTLLFIPQSNRLYWELEPNCESTALIAPAITGIAMIDGLPKVGCEAKGYGYEIYSLRRTQQSSFVMSKNQLCSKALAQGFSQIIVIDSKANSVLRTDVSCF